MSRGSVDTISMDRLRILAIDDQPDVVELWSALIDQLGHECRTARSGQEALEVADEFDPDLILLDIGLPDMTGYALSRALRARPRGADVYIAAVTGWSRKQDIDHAFEAGIDHHIAKPATRLNLRDAIAAAQAHLDRGQSR
jgi:CheY-like chemotaxis protein